MLKDRVKQLVSKDKFEKYTETVEKFISDILREHGYDAAGNRLANADTAGNNTPVEEDFGVFLPDKMESRDLPY